VVKTLISNDEPVETMGKYAAPRAWRGQALLVLSSNKLIQMPSDDGGLSSRLSFVKMPFTWVKEAHTPTERTVDPEVKLKKVPLMVDEFVFWSVHLNNGLLQQPPKDRVLRPRPFKVEDDTAALFGGKDDEDARRTALHKFIETRCKQAGDETTTTRGLQPTLASAFEVAAAKHMLDSCSNAYQLPKNMAEYLGQELVFVTSDRKKPHKVGDKVIRSFYKVKNVPGKPFATALYVIPTTEGLAAA
jgi:hypothetical protein